MNQLLTVIWKIYFRNIQLDKMLKCFHRYFRLNFCKFSPSFLSGLSSNKTKIHLGLVYKTILFSLCEIHELLRNSVTAQCLLLLTIQKQMIFDEEKPCRFSLKSDFLVKRCTTLESPFLSQVTSD